MRDIRFRGYDKKNKKWVYGAYIKHIDATPCIFTNQKERIEWEKEHTHHIIVFDEFSDWWMPRNITFCRDIDPDSIGQYIGLMDNQRKFIYEGDIVEYTFANCDNNLYEVKFNEKTFCYQLVNDKESVNIEFAFKSRIKVIGNKYEHKES